MANSEIWDVHHDLWHPPSLVEMEPCATSYCNFLHFHFVVLFFLIFSQKAILNDRIFKIKVDGTDVYSFCKLEWRRRRNSSKHCLFMSFKHPQKQKPHFEFYFSDLIKLLLLTAFVTNETWKIAFFSYIWWNLWEPFLLLINKLHRLLTY